VRRPVCLRLQLHFPLADFPPSSPSMSFFQFSRIAPADSHRPSYQASAVSTYLTALGSTNSGKFVRTGRAFPDVSAMGQNVEIFNVGKSGKVAGTSCSSPIFASVIALLNDELIAAGKAPLGFLNPFLCVHRPFSGLMLAHWCTATRRA
jgi:hypothetical protein